MAPNTLYPEQACHASCAGFVVPALPRSLSLRACSRAIAQMRTPAALPSSPKVLIKPCLGALPCSPPFPATAHRKTHVLICAHLVRTFTHRSTHGCNEQRNSHPIQTLLSMGCRGQPTAQLLAYCRIHTHSNWLLLPSALAAHTQPLLYPTFSIHPHMTCPLQLCHLHARPQVTHTRLVIPGGALMSCPSALLLSPPWPPCPQQGHLPCCWPAWP